MPYLVIRTLVSALQSQRALAVESPALRHQHLVLQRNTKKPRLRRMDRFLWVLLLRVWTGWRESMAIRQPETVIRWHREGFRLYWRWKSRSGRPGRTGYAGKSVIWSANCRKVIRFYVTETPSAWWTGRQITPTGAQVPLRLLPRMSDTPRAGEGLIGCSRFSVRRRGWSAMARPTDGVCGRHGSETRS